MNLEPLALYVVIDDKLLDLFESILGDIKDPDLRARIADVVWLTGKSRGRVLPIAVDAYMESTKRLLDPDDWIPGIDRLRRAVDLSRRMGKKCPQFIAIMAFVKSIVENKINQEIASNFIWYFVEILIKHKQGDPLFLAKIVGEIATNAENQKEFSLAENYWDLQSSCYSAVGEEENSKLAKKRQAEAMVRNALEGCPFSHARATSLLRDAIKLYRNIGGEQERVRELHDEMIRQEHQMMEREMKTEEINCPQDMSQGLEALRRKTIEEISKASNLDMAFKILFNSGFVVSYEQAQTEAEKYMSKFSVSVFFNKIFVTDDGKKIADVKSRYTDDPEKQKEALEQQIIQTVFSYHKMTALYLVEPTREVMVEKFPPDTINWDDIVQGCMLVPDGRERLFCEALKAGYSGNFVVSTHILATQWEHTLRSILQKLGELTSKLDDDLNQDELSLSSLLEFESLEWFFHGKDIPLNLRVSLGEKLGANLRNKVAHGLMGYDDFYQPESVYLWWITLVLIHAYSKKEENTGTGK